VVSPYRLKEACWERIFKLEEEGTTALLLHLLKVFAEAAVLGSAIGLGCWLVVATVQPTE
jgi:hypothetical protein